jgi:cytoskeletal protein CcmA (bactofilin family)
MSAPCPKCHKPLIVEDVVVKAYKPVKLLQTCGMLIVRKGGRVAATQVEAHAGVMCDGAIHASVVSGGPVVIGAKAEWKGDLRAPSLQIRPGARLLGGYFQIPTALTE